MKIIAYLCTDYIYFSKLMPELQKSCEVLPLVLCEVLQKFGDQLSMEAFAGVWDYLLQSEKFDAIWCYGLPDEVTIHKSREYKIPLLLQEYWGHYPYNLTGILAHDCDFRAHYKKETETLPETDGRKNASPVITVCMSDGLYDSSLTLNEFMKRYEPGGLSPRNPFWLPNRVFSSYFGFAASVIELCRKEEILQDCRVRVRLHPRYPDLFKDAAGYVESLNDSRYTVDTSPVAEAVEETDIAVQVNSNFGFDCIRSGAEVVSAGGYAFFDNPQLTSVARTKDELKRVLIGKVDKIRREGRRMKSFMPLLTRDLETVLHHPCLEPYESGKITEVIERAAGMPLIEFV